MVDSPFLFLSFPMLQRGLLLNALLCLAFALPSSSPAAAGKAVPITGSVAKEPGVREKTQPPNVILITLDTTRADRMGFLGAAGGLTPHLDALAKEGVVFTRAYSHVPLTTPSHANILTGTYPQYNQVTDLGKPLRPDLPYLPDLLHHRGYRTGAFVGSLILDPANGLAPGFERGFDVYDAGYHVKRHGEDRYKTIERRAEDVVAHAMAWLAKSPKPPHRPPFLLWVHLYDAHDPYDPPAPYAEKYKSAPYDGEIAYTDAAVGKLLAALRARGMYDSSVIAVMADHGEAFGEHGERTHGIFLYDETIHVPLVIKLPGNRSAGTRVTSRAGLVDVLPTLLQVAGVAVPKEVQGRSLIATMKSATAKSVAAKFTVSKTAAKSDADEEDHPAYAETDYPKRAFGWSELRALRAGKYLYVQAPERELYDQAADPAAARNLVKNSTAVADTLGSQLADFRRRTSSTSAQSTAQLDPEQTQKLSALGYVASAATTGGDAGAAAIDPKGKIEVANAMHDAIIDVEDGRFEHAIPLLEKVIETQPNMPIAHMQLGTAWTHLKNYDKAVPVLRHALELSPDNGMGHYNLGLALFETGDWKSAAPEFEAAVAKAPRWADAQFSLASVYARIDRVPEALDHLKIALEIVPDHYRANLLNGRILSLQGKAAEALPFLEKAVKVQPESKEAHLFLGDAYGQLGRDNDALRERMTAASKGAVTH